MADERVLSMTLTDANTAAAEMERIGKDDIPALAHWVDTEQRWPKPVLYTAVSAWLGRDLQGAILALYVPQRRRHGR